MSVSQSVGLLLPHHGCSLCRCPALACEFLSDFLPSFCAAFFIKKICSLKILFRYFFFHLGYDMSDIHWQTFSKDFRDFFSLQHYIRSLILSRLRALSSVAAEPLSGFHHVGSCCCWCERVRSCMSCQTHFLTQIEAGDSTKT